MQALRAKGNTQLNSHSKDYTQQASGTQAKNNSQAIKLC